MSTPQRELVDAALIAAFQAITTGGGYNNTVLTVQLVERDLGVIGPAACPTVAIAYQGTEFPEDYVGEIIQVTSRYLISGTIATPSATTRAALVARWEDDLIAALGADPELGGACMDVRVLESMDSAAVAEEQANSRGGVATVRMLARVRYQRTTGLTPA